MVGCFKAITNGQEPKTIDLGNLHVEMVLATLGFEQCTHLVFKIPC